MLRELHEQVTADKSSGQPQIWRNIYKEGAALDHLAIMKDSIADLIP
jgi:hypothetical protein